MAPQQCWQLLALVAYKLKPVKLLGPCKRTQHCWPTTSNNVGSCWHLLRPFAWVFTNISGIFCHFNYEHICHARQREEAKATAANYSLSLALSKLFISIGLSVAVLDRYLPGSTDDISRDELLNDTSIWAFNIVKFYCFLL